MFTVQERDRIHDHVLEMAGSDERVVAGAVVGSLALNEGDRWSDLDLTFAVRDGQDMFQVLEEWTKSLEQEFGAVCLFDLPAGPSIYRVFLMPGCLQFDLSFTPASKFGATGPKFKLLFGNAVQKAFVQPPPAHELFGYAVHHALRARFCIERGKYWQAEYWISSLRDYGLMLACLQRGLPTAHGRGYDQLPSKVLKKFQKALVKSLDRQELLRAHKAALEALFTETEDVKILADKVEPQLAELTQEWRNE